MSDNQLSWPSAFWAVVAIALNSMSQPSGKVLGYPAKYSFLLRSSPIICATHAIDSLLQLAYCVLRAASMSEAVAAWAAKRFDDAEAFEDARKSNKYFLFLFALGALLQAIKIFGCGGVLGTKILCSLFLSSFVIDGTLLAVIATVALPETQELPHHGSSENMKTYYGSKYVAAAVIVVSSYAAARALVLSGLGTYFSHEPHGAAVAISAAVLFPVLGFAIQSIVAFCLLRFVVDLGVGAPLSNAPLVGYEEITAYWTINGLAALQLDRLPFLAMLPSVVLFSVGGAPALLLRAAWFKRRIVSERQRRRYHETFCFSFGLVHSVSAVLWYWQMYDAASTYRPSWMNFLG